MIDVSDIPGAPGKFKGKKIPKGVYETAKFILDAAGNAKNAKGIINKIDQKISEEQLQNNQKKDQSQEISYDTSYRHNGDWDLDTAVDKVITDEKTGTQSRERVKDFKESSYYDKN